MADYVLKIIDDISKLTERVDEIDANTDYETVKSVVHSLKDTLKANNDLTALCAPQIGTALRIFCVKFADGKIRAFLNPMIVSSKGMHLSRETNASLRNKEFIIPRHDEIGVAYQEVNGKVEMNSFKGVPAEVVQQMIEMLDGITLADYGLDLDDVGGAAEFDKATKKDQAAVISMYLETLKGTEHNLKQEIETTPDLKNIDRTLDMMTGLIKGDIKPVDKDGNVVEAKKDK